MTSLERKSAFEKAFTLTRPSSFLEARNFLGDFYKQVKKQLPHYSYIEFSKDLGFSATNVIFLVIKGKRPLSEKAAEKISEAIGLHGTEHKYFLTVVAYENCNNPLERELIFQKLLALKSNSPISSLSKAQLNFFSEWYHPVIRELVGLEKFSSDPAWIASQLRPKIRPMQVMISLKLLEELNLIYFDENKNRYVQSEAILSTGDEVSSMSIIRYHQKTIELAKESITAISETERDVSSILVPASKESYERVKLEIQLFRKKLMQICEESTNKDLVMQINFQVFPVSSKGDPK